MRKRPRIKAFLSFLIFIRLPQRLHRTLNTIIIILRPYEIDSRSFSFAVDFAPPGSRVQELFYYVTFVALFYEEWAVGCDFGSFVADHCAHCSLHGCAPSIITFIFRWDLLFSSILLLHYFTYEFYEFLSDYPWVMVLKEQIAFRVEISLTQLHPHSLSHSQYLPHILNTIISIILHLIQKCYKFIVIA